MTSVRLGLTGSIGMGKSTVARMFAEEEVPVFDADAVVHHLQGPDGALVDDIEAHFPGSTGVEGVNRTTLAERVLGEPAALRRLEALIHPAVALERERFLEHNRDAPLVCSKRAAGTMSRRSRWSRRRPRSSASACWRVQA